MASTPMAGSTSSSCPLRSRLYVGGLGASVTSSDMERTFNSLGRVCSVDIIRSKDRNFAYMDFEVASSKDLQRLLSLYNGCIWKGGLLRVEKAREHYLDRLRREWAEDSAVPAGADCLSNHSNICPKGNDGNTCGKDVQAQCLRDLKIYFPGLKRLQKVPSKGLGKHKRSFEHMESLPLLHLQTDFHEETKSGIGSGLKQDGVAHNNRATGNHLKKGPIKEMGTQDCSFEHVDNHHLLHLQDYGKNSYEETKNGDGSGLDQDRVAYSDKPAKERKDVATEKMTQLCNTRVTDDLSIPKVKCGKNWVQKASWKTLVGDPTAVAFTLGRTSGLGPSKPHTSPIQSATKAHVLPLVLASEDHVGQDSKGLTKKQAEQEENGNNVDKSSKTNMQSAISSLRSSRRVSSPGAGKILGHDFKATLENTVNNGVPLSQRLENTSEGDLSYKQVPLHRNLSSYSRVNYNDKVCAFIRSENAEQEWKKSKKLLRELVKVRRKEALRSIKKLKIPSRKL